jgi:hypothetical protein
VGLDGGVGRIHRTRHHRERVRLLGVELLTELAAHGPGAGALRQHPVVRLTELDAEERRAEEEEQGHDGGGDGDGTAHDGRRHPVPEAGPVRARRTVEERHPPGVDPPSEDREQRREAEHRHRGGHHHDRDAGVGEGPQEVHGEHEQGRERDGDDQRREGDRATCGLDRAHHRVVRLCPPTHLLPEAGDDEQAVVDGEAEAERRRDVDREDRHVGHLRDREEREEGPEHGQGPDEERQQGGHEGAEDEHQQHEGDRHGDRLRLRQVPLDGRADLPEHLGLAADLDADGAPRRHTGERLADLGHDLLDRLVLAGDAAEHEGAVAFPARQRVAGHGLPADGPVGDDVVDARGGEALLERSTRCGCTGIGDRAAGRGDEEDHVGLPLAEAVLEQLPRLGRLGPGVLEPAALEDAEDAGAEGDGGDEEQPDHAEDDPAPPHHEMTECCEHDRLHDVVG